MCGVFGYIGDRSCKDLILSGLKALEYRGYDSAGIATLSAGGKISLIKRKGKVSTLEPLLDSLPEENSIGLGHTRWATHGYVSDHNAHPHVYKNFALVHNGIIDNYLELKSFLEGKAYEFSTETDTEVVLKLLDLFFSELGSVEKALYKLTESLKGSYALGVLCSDEKETLYLVRRKSPLIIGLGKNENFFASDLSALAPHTKEFVFIKDHQYAKISKNELELRDFEGNLLQHKKVTLDDFSLSKNSKGAHEHFMLKEIYEQKEIILSHIEKFYDLEACFLRDVGAELHRLDLKQYKHVVLLGCGSAYYAASAALYTLEEHFRVPVSIHLASEFRHRKMHLDEKTLVLSISQSGETADTLSSSEFAKSKGATLIAVCNTPYSSLTRLADFTMYIQSGTEVGVAATKTFTATLLSLMTLSYSFGKKLGTVSDESFKTLLRSLEELPGRVDQVFETKNSYNEIAKKYSSSSSFLFIGRGHLYPISCEGALKLKEISYCHAEAYSSGELKHGPISLVTEELPIVALCPEDASYKKLFSNMEEVAARKGRLIAVGRKQNRDLDGICESVLDCPELEEPLLQGLLSNIPLQFFAYYVALDLKREIDQPRNLAKSVTVE